MERAELEHAFTGFRARVDANAAQGIWSTFADEFTEDAVYRRRGYDDFVGREAIRTWITEAMTTFPGTMIEGFEVVWSTVDPARLQVAYELLNVMRDPGDGSVHAASTTSILLWDPTQRLWSRAADLHNPYAYADMVRGWMRCARALGTLGPDGEAYLAAAAG